MQIDCSQYKLEIKRKLEMAKWFVPLVAGICGLIVCVVIRFDRYEYGTSFFSMSNLEAGWFAALVFGMPLLAVPITKVNLKSLSETYKIAKNHNLVFSVSDEGITSPTLLLTNPALITVIEKKIPHLLIPWGDIEKLDVHSGMGQSSSQYSLHVCGKTGVYGEGVMGFVGPDGRRFGIKRKPLGEKDYEIVQIFRKYLGEKLAVSDKRVRNRPESL